MWSSMFSVLEYPVLVPQVLSKVSSQLDPYRKGEEDPERLSFASLCLFRYPLDYGCTPFLFFLLLTKYPIANEK